MTKSPSSVRAEGRRYIRATGRHVLLSTVLRAACRGMPNHAILPHRHVPLEPCRPGLRCLGAAGGRRGVADVVDQRGGDASGTSPARTGADEGPATAARVAGPAGTAAPPASLALRSGAVEVPGMALRWRRGGPVDLVAGQRDGGQRRHHVPLGTAPRWRPSRPFKFDGVLAGRAPRVRIHGSAGARYGENAALPGHRLARVARERSPGLRAF